MRERERQHKELLIHVIPNIDELQKHCAKLMSK